MKQSWLVLNLRDGVLKQHGQHHVMNDGSLVASVMLFVFTLRSFLATVVGLHR